MMFRPGALYSSHRIRLCNSGIFCIIYALLLALVLYINFELLPTFFNYLQLNCLQILHQMFKTWSVIFLISKTDFDYITYFSSDAIFHFQPTTPYHLLIQFKKQNSLINRFLEYREPLLGYSGAVSGNKRVFELKPVKKYVGAQELNF